MSNVRRIYVEKKPQYAVAAGALKEEISDFLGIGAVTGLRRLIRYDVENISDSVFETACRSVFCEPPVDILYTELPEESDTVRIFSVEALPGQFDQRADSAVQCVRFLSAAEDPVIKTAETYIIEGSLTDEEFDRIRSYCINPVDSRESTGPVPETLSEEYPEAEPVKRLDGMTGESDDALKERYDGMSLAMTFADFVCIRDYFRDTEKRDPSLTELKVLDTYWSDHCRHTTFSTVLTDISFEEGVYSEPMEITMQSYLDTRKAVYGEREKPLCLMDLALMGMRKLKADGILTDMEESEENNACTVIVPVEADYGSGPVTEEWLLFFKNETHNHPTEIEPFGGAATCLGGAIRDPLSGRGYVYQAMRVTGAADPTVPVSETLYGKLPQKKLVTGAAKGYSSYGNQIGLATGHVREIYHPGYAAKRMEIGAVMGAAPRKNVRRLSPEPGDAIILLGGRTGRDGIGGATGSSKAHTTDSTLTCGAEVQKGNAPTERKLQRLFRRPEVTQLIKKCNDFGAGGVCVAIGELADGLSVDLDLVPRKYEGLDGTELAISESQERMAVVVAPEDEKAFLDFAGQENLEATTVARVTEEKRLVMYWKNDRIVDISREFLSSNGASQFAQVVVKSPDPSQNIFEQYASGKVGEILEAGADDAFEKALLSSVSDLNTCSQKGLIEMFDSSIGAGTVTMPFGGRYQMTAAQAMTAKIPVLHGKSRDVSVMAYGFDPYISSWSPYHGAIYAVMHSIAKLVASGADLSRLHFTFQEYFGRMTGKPERWGLPFAALLGAYDAQIGFGYASIGGKDSMSGSFEDLDVPPTLVSFAVTMGKSGNIITPELKKKGSQLVRIYIEKDEYDIPVYDDVLSLYNKILGLIGSGEILSASAPDSAGVLPAAVQMAFGNHFGIHFDERVRLSSLFDNAVGEILAEMGPDADKILKNAGIEDFDIIGTVTDGKDGFTHKGGKVSLEDALNAWEAPLSRIFPIRAKNTETDLYLPDELYTKGSIAVCSGKIGRPEVFIPVFPGTNCEYDSEAAFLNAGARTNVQVFRSRTAEEIRESVKCFGDAIGNAQIVMFPGGFSAGDEPDGSPKFFATAFRDAYIREMLLDLLTKRDGLVLGICNGFQALVKLGLLPFGRMNGQDEDSATLTFNTIGRHISRMVYTKAASNLSPWLMNVKPGDVFCNPASHGEGRFVADKAVLDELFKNGQIATRYCDPDGNVTMDSEWNVNGSFAAIEGITSPDGRVLGKMLHCERRGSDIAVNISGEQDMHLFESGCEYFS